MTKCIATVGDVFVGTDRNIFIEDIDITRDVCNKGYIDFIPDS